MQHSNYEKHAAELRDEADALIRETNILVRLGELGDATIVGSHRYDLMVRPDIDIEVYADHTDVELVVDMMADYAKSTSVITQLRNYTEYCPTATMPRAIYLGLQMVRDATMWNMDIWFLAHDDALAIAGLSGGWWRALSGKQRADILKLKDQLKAVKSVDIYRAVVIGGATDEASVRQWLEPM